MKPSHVVRRCCCVPLCCRRSWMYIFAIDPCCHRFQHPQRTLNTQHTTHMKPVSCPGTQRWGLRCCTASSAIWVATQVASFHGEFADGEWRVFQLSFVFCFWENGMKHKSGNSLRYTTKTKCKSISCRSNSQRICLKSKAYLYNSKCVLMVHLCEKKSMG